MVLVSLFAAFFICHRAQKNKFNFLIFVYVYNVHIMDVGICLKVLKKSRFNSIIYNDG